MPVVAATDVEEDRTAWMNPPGVTNALTLASEAATSATACTERPMALSLLSPHFCGNLQRSDRTTAVELIASSDVSLLS